MLRQLSGVQRSAMTRYSSFGSESAVVSDIASEVFDPEHYPNSMQLCGTVLQTRAKLPFVRGLRHDTGGGAPR